MNKTISGSLIAACLALALVAGTGTARAADGQLNAVSNKPLPTAPTFAVRALDDSDAALAVKKRFVADLKAKGYRIDDKSPLIFTFEIIDEVGAFTNTDRRYFIDLGARGSRTGGEDAHARFNVFDSKTGGILNEGEGGTKIVTPTKYRLRVTIDQQDGPNHLERYWQGWMTGNLGTADNQTLVEAMIAPLVDNIGKTVRSHPYPLPD